MKRKVILFYSSIGQGHISAANAIEKEIRRQDPSAIVSKKDIRDFMDPLLRIIDEKVYWFIAKNLPLLFDNLFITLQEEGNQAGSLSQLANDYPEEKVLEYIKIEAPDTILATHYGSAQVLGTLREKGLIPGIKIGWLHTDYFEGYFPRISKRIDRTFLAHPELESRWIKAGVPTELVVTTGMPVSVPQGQANASKECLSSIGLDPKIRTIVIACGKEGAGNFIGAIKSIGAEAKEPLQIIAVCGLNAKQQKGLEKIQPEIRKQVNLKVMGFIPQADLVSFIQASDLFITKAGGLSPAEAVTLGKPTVLLNVISGHERENAELFSKLGMAVFNRDIKNLGVEVMDLIQNKEKQECMFQAQRAYQENIDIEKIARFALDPALRARSPQHDFGLEHGLAPSNIREALEQLEKDAPADMEILLSYSSSKEDERIVMENPFGHIAIRVGPIVYSSNHISDPVEDTFLLQNLSLEEYLFGVSPPSDNQVHTSTYGMAYGRDTLGFRIKGLTADALKCMHKEAAEIEEEFRDGRCRWDLKKSNCADYVARILRSGGYDIDSMEGPSCLYTMPLDVFEKVYTAFQENPVFQTELVAYRRLPGSKADYRFCRFPLSLGQPVRALTKVLADSIPDKLEKEVAKQITGYVGDDRIYYENLLKRTSASIINSRSHARSIEEVLIGEAHHLISEQKHQYYDAYRRRLEYLMQDPPDFVERCRHAIRLSSEDLKEFLKSPTMEKIRRTFLQQ
jgi:UDP-N-acetylglucosamine:LPS N-acetylglucosamine transferase